LIYLLTDLPVKNSICYRVSSIDTKSYSVYRKYK